MVKESSPQAIPCTADRLVLRPVGLDDWASVRYVHTASFRAHAGGHFAESELDAFAKLVRSQRYIDRLLGENVHAAFLEDQMVGTCGWTPADDNGALARITAIYVRPFFTRMGIGRQLVTDAEARARTAGFERFSVRVTFNAVGFFEKLGYDVTSYGIQALTTDQGLPVTYMRKRMQAEVGAETAAQGVGGGTSGSEPGDAAVASISALATPRDR